MFVGARTTMQFGSTLCAQQVPNRENGCTVYTSGSVWVEPDVLCWVLHVDTTS